MRGSGVVIPLAAGYACMVIGECAAGSEKNGRETEPKTVLFLSFPGTFHPFFPFFRSSNYSKVQPQLLPLPQHTILFLLVGPTLIYIYFPSSF